jgi:hypothetical protein
MNRLLDRMPFAPGQPKPPPAPTPYPDAALAPAAVDSSDSSLEFIPHPRTPSLTPAVSPTMQEWRSPTTMEEEDSRAPLAHSAPRAPGAPRSPPHAPHSPPKPRYPPRPPRPPSSPSRPPGTGTLGFATLPLPGLHGTRHRERTRAEQSGSAVEIET